ncbi:MAG TPA: isochorismatase family protein [Anaeromyxobacter sp.]|nr:isochorismatase family protein [Anaeromyxobacter sp.]
MPLPLKLDPSRTIILLVDVQERLCPAMPPAALAQLLKYAQALLSAARELSLPVLATEQYPKGLGPTLPGLRELLPAPPLAKMSFSCGGDPGFTAALESIRLRLREPPAQIVLAGMEAHVCVFQTARDLVAAGYEVQVCADAVASRDEEHRRIGLDLCREAGALVTTAETALFDLLGVCGTPAFKKVSQLVK